jgi:hypothetical protein
VVKLIRNPEKPIDNPDIERHKDGPIAIHQSDASTRRERQSAASTLRDRRPVTLRICCALHGEPIPDGEGIGIAPVTTDSHESKSFGLFQFCGLNCLVEWSVDYLFKSLKGMSEELDEMHKKLRAVRQALADT